MSPKGSRCMAGLPQADHSTIQWGKPGPQREGSQPALGPLLTRLPDSMREFGGSGWWDALWYHSISAHLPFKILATKKQDVGAEDAEHGGREQARSFPPTHVWFNLWTTYRQDSLLNPTSNHEGEAAWGHSSQVWAWIWDSRAAEGGKHYRSSQVCLSVLYLLAAWPRVRYLSSLWLSFPIHRIGIVILPNSVDL